MTKACAKGLFLLLPLLAALLFSTNCQAAEHFGIPVYPGATTDAATARQQAASAKESGKMQAAKGSKNEVYCYRTSDPFEKVVAWYKSHKKVGLIDLSDKGGNKYALFCPNGNVMACAVMGNGIDLGIMTPWEEEQKHNDILIQFRKASR